jgi:hypothetical protein
MLQIKLVSWGCLLVLAMEVSLIQRLHIQISWEEMKQLYSGVIWKLRYIKDLVMKKVNTLWISVEIGVVCVR